MNLVRKTKLLLLAMACAVAAVFAVGVRGEEIKRFDQ
jgi:hypothetical protein